MSRGSCLSRLSESESHPCSSLARIITGYVTNWNWWDELGRRVRHRQNAPKTLRELYDEQHPTSLYPTIDWFYASEMRSYRCCKMWSHTLLNVTAFVLYYVNTLSWYLFCTMSNAELVSALYYVNTLSWYLFCTMSTRWVGIFFVLCQYDKLVYVLYNVKTLSWHLFSTMSTCWVGICFVLCQHAELVYVLYLVNTLSWYLFCTMSTRWGGF